MNKPLFSFITILLSIGFAFFYVKPEYTLVEGRSANLTTLADIAKGSGRIKKLINDTEKNLNGVDSADLARFDMFLPEVIDPIRFANNIQRIGFTNGVVLENIKVEEPAVGTSKNIGLNSSGQSQQGGAIQGVVNTFSMGSKGDQTQRTTLDGMISGAVLEKKYATTKTSFGFTSTYEAFGKFLFDIEKSLGLINVTALSFHPSIETTDVKKIKRGSPPMYQFTVTIETYSLK